MRTLLKGSLALLTVFCLATLSVQSLACDTYNRVTKTLYAGQKTPVGTLTVEQYKSGGKKMLRVTYDTSSSGWVMNTTHLYVGTCAPKKSAPGRFPYKHEGLDKVTVDVYEIPIGCKPLYIAAHADVCEDTAGSGGCVPDYAAAAAALPGGLTDLNVEWAGYISSYFTSHTTFGTFLSWCLDYNGPIGNEVTYGTAYVFSLLPDGSPNPAAAALLGSQAAALSGSPINYLNYLINQPYVIDCGNGGPYSVVDIQVAIWHITNGLAISSFGANVANVTAILDDVIANGASFVPTCDDLALVVGDPQTPDPGGNYQHNQHFGFAVPVTGEVVQGDCETAWAKGTCQFRTGWGSYFKYCVK